ncbi:carboxypeptidase-like regulatory domain-containing protein [Hymenobacter sp. BT559]|uniref:carboxypeptidase-like regulatory domain-containing protein n=1 Tax=Hymenobacter sp. BT559 TaxID=2795729 RepID=UPI0018EA94F7|nr:carboxypeptidase-like regulatory domain-containing protein [Hymenobacter sp. BT559]MBJ6143437.1 carboxypeptidase-like regulatory domain-containing protein [Hymenobacter sp. BT559]
MRVFLQVAALVLLGPMAYGQGQVSSKVLDRQTHQPVPYASVAVLGSAAGTTSNSEGEFVLTLKTLPAKLVVSQLSYKRDTLAVATASSLGTIELAPAPVTLPIVEMGSYTAELLRKAYRELQRSYSTKQYGQAFYRQITYLDGTPTEVQEMLWHTKASNAGLEGTALMQARYAKQKAALLNYRNFSYFTKDFNIYSTKGDTARKGAILSPDAAEYYTLRLVGITQRDEQSLAEVAFVGKPAFNPQHVQGSLVIDTNTYQILRFKVGIDREMHANNPTFKFKEGRMEYEIVFRPTATGAVPDHLTTTHTVILTRLLKPEVQLRASALAYFYNWQATLPAGLTYAAPNGKESDLVMVKQAAYDPLFWRDNPVVKRTPLEEGVIRAFEQQKSFGTMLTD